ncbi:MAG: hypothetical protein IJ849_08425 [Selenomonadaceae bacterium]|nr:hypothetical protein [Selenomonadaceae bacterium]
MEKLITHGLLVTLCISFFAVLTRPLALDAFDLWERLTFTEADSEASYGLPFAVVKPEPVPTQMLNRAQIRWLLIQNERLKVFHEAISPGNSEGQAAFNEMVREYNQRADYSFETADMEAAKEDVAQHLEFIRAAALDEVLSSGWEVPDSDKDEKKNDAE